MRRFCEHYESEEDSADIVRIRNAERDGTERWRTESTAATHLPSGEYVTALTLLQTKHRVISVQPKIAAGTIAAQLPKPRLTDRSGPSAETMARGVSLSIL